MNKVILIGRITKDPELKTTANGVSVCSFTLAVNRRFKNSEGNYDTDFINCVAWRQQADFLTKYIKKGQMLSVCGSIQTRSYEKDGKRVYVTEIMVDEVGSIGKNESPAETENKPSNTVETTQGFMPQPINDGDLPF